MYPSSIRVYTTYPSYCVVHMHVHVHVYMNVWILYIHVHVHVLMRDERRKKERSKQRQTNKQGKATQHTHVHVHVRVCICFCVGADMSSSLEGGLGDVAIEVLHRLLSHLLLSPEDEVGVAKDSVDAFVQTLRRGIHVATHVHVYTCTCIHVLMRDEKGGRNKQARSNKQTRQSNTAHPRQSLFLRKMSCLGWDSNPRHSTL